MTNSAIFSGIEAEGRLKGVPTIFSERPCLEAVEEARRLGYTHIFFGAKGHVLSKEDYEELLKLMHGGIPPEMLVTLHVPILKAHEVPLELWSVCHVLLYIGTVVAPLLGGDVEIKLENRTHAAVYARPQMIDLSYIYDKEVS